MIRRARTSLLVATCVLGLLASATATAGPAAPRRPPERTAATRRPPAKGHGRRPPRTARARRARARAARRGAPYQRRWRQQARWSDAKARLALRLVKRLELQLGLSVPGTPLHADLLYRLGRARYALYEYWDGKIMRLQFHQPHAP